MLYDKVMTIWMVTSTCQYMAASYWLLNCDLHRTLQRSSIKRQWWISGSWRLPRSFQRWTASCSRTRTACWRTTDCWWDVTVDHITTHTYSAAGDTGTINVFCCHFITRLVVWHFSFNGYFTYFLGRPNVSSEGLMFCCRCFFLFAGLPPSSVGRSPRNFAAWSQCVRPW